MPSTKKKDKEAKAQARAASASSSQAISRSKATSGSSQEEERGDGSAQQQRQKAIDNSRMAREARKTALRIATSSEPNSGDAVDNSVMAREARKTTLQMTTSSGSTATAASNAWQTKPTAKPKDEEEEGSASASASAVPDTPWEGPSLSIGGGESVATSNSVSTATSTTGNGRKVRAMVESTHTMQEKMTPASRDRESSINEKNKDKGGEDASLAAMSDKLAKRSLRAAEEIAVQEMVEESPSPPVLATQNQHVEPGAFRFAPSHPPRRAGELNHSVYSTMTREESSSEVNAESSGAATLPQEAPGGMVLLQATLVQSEREEDDGAAFQASPAAVHAVSSKMVEAKEVNIEEEDVVGIKKRSLLIGGLILLLIVGVVGVVVGVIIGGDDGGSSGSVESNPGGGSGSNGGNTDRGLPSPSPSAISPTPSPSTTSPTNAPTVDPVKSMIIDAFQTSLPVETQQRLQDPASPQSSALAWLQGNARLVEYNDARLMQRFAMATLYYSTNGHQWTSDAGWLSDDDECTWSTDSGTLFTCTGQTLEWLELIARNLLGELPPELGYVTSLIGIDLSENTLVGEIPTTLGLLPDLEGIWLFQNSLTGSIPSELSEIAGLMFLDLEDNILESQIPSELQQLVLLQEIWLNRNIFTGGIPTWLSQFTLLDLLHMDANGFDGPIPTQLGLLQSASVIDLSETLLTGDIPSQLASIPNLNTLHLYDTLLSGVVPAELCARVTNDGLLLTVDCEFVLCNCNCDCSWTTPLE